MILFRYLFKEVFLTMFSVASIVLVISLGWRFGSYMEDAASGGISKDILLLLLMLRLPGFLELILPVSFFLGIILGYGRFYADSEMIILQVCGVSQKKMIGMTMVMALVVILVTTLITLWLKPWSEARVESMFEEQRSLTEFDTLAPGRFQTIRSGKRVTYTEELGEDGTIVSPFINEFSDGVGSGPREVNTLIATSGSSQLDKYRDGQFLVLESGYRYSGAPGKANYQLIEYEKYGQLIEREETQKRARRRSAIDTLELLQDDSLRSQAELHWRIGVVLLIPIIALIAIPLSKVNPRQGRFTRLVPALLLCFSYILLLSVARSSMERGDTPVFLGLWWVHFIFILITLMLYQMEGLLRSLSGIVRGRG